ncbi:MAG: tetratricopeptide repeat protein [Bacteroidales bacterium]|nr:tetratricopeptide repeat protein [Bacteroidales bacterium]
MLFAVILHAQTEDELWAHKCDSLENILATQQLSSYDLYFTHTRLMNEYSHRGQRHKTIRSIVEGLKQADRGNDKSMIVAYSLLVGGYHDILMKWDSAAFYFNKALDNAIASGDKWWITKAYLNLGNSNDRQGKYAKSLQYYMKLLDVYKNNGYDNWHHYSMAIGNISEIYLALENYDRAFYYIEQSKESADNLPVNYVLGAIYLHRGELDKALEYELDAFEDGCKDYETYGSFSARILSKIYLQKQDYENAMKYARASMICAQKVSDAKLCAAAWNVISDVYREQGHYRECEEAALKAFEIDSLSLNITPNVTFNIALSNIYLGNKDKASGFFKRFRQVMMQESDRKFTETLLDMEVAYETEKKEMRIASLEKERLLYIWLGAAVILLVTALGIVFRQKIKTAQREKQLIATRSVLDGEMGERTRLARDLHDRLCGNLAAVKIKLKDNQSVQNVADKLDSCIDEIRRVAHNLMPVSLQYGMKVALEDFTAQFSNVHFHFFGEEKQVEERTEFVIYCCANELITNALRHANAQNINLQLVQDENHISLTVEDDGCGFDEKAIEKGFGLKNIRDRVTSCNGKMDIFTAPDKGTEITIEIITICNNV